MRVWGKASRSPEPLETLQLTNAPHLNAVYRQGRSQKFVLGGYSFFFFWGGGIKLLNSRSDVILPHKKFTWADFLGV